MHEKEFKLKTGRRRFLMGSLATLAERLLGQLRGEARFEEII